MYFASFCTICLMAYIVGALRIEKKSSPRCRENPADIIIVMDESNSIHDYDFELQRQFVLSLINAYTINPQKVKIGVISWSSWTRKIWDLVDADKQKLKAKIGSFQRVYHDPAAPPAKMVYGHNESKGDETFTWWALDDTREMLQNQRRPNVPAFVIVMTDGEASWTDGTRMVKNAATNLQQLRDVTVFAIGIGQSITDKAIVELHSIATDPDEGDNRHYFKLEKYNELNEDLRDILIEGTCETSPSPSKEEPTCTENPADIIIVIDESNSIHDDDFERQKQFVLKLVGSYSIDRQKVRIGLISWSSWTRKIWDLSNVDEEGLKARIDSFIRVFRDPSAPAAKMVYGHSESKGDETFTWWALDDTREMLQNQRRPNVPAFVFVMTDGEASWTDGTRMVKNAARNLQQLSDVTVFAIGIGQSITEEAIEQLHSIATDPDDGDNRHYFKLENYDELNEELRHILIKGTCGNNITIDPCNKYADIKIDLAFVLGSIYQNYMGAKEALGFISKITKDDRLPIDPQGVRVALVPINSSPIGFYLKDKTNKQSVLEHFAVTRNMFENTVDLIDFMRDQTFSQIHGDRPDAENLAVIILDRTTPKTMATIRAAEAAKRKGIKIFAIGVGKQVNNEELLSIASEPKLKFNVDTYDELWNLRDKILYEKICIPEYMTQN